MKPELLDQAQLPYAFSSRKLAGETVGDIYQESLSLGELEREKLHKISEVLNHPQLETLINEGKLTLGMIKPRAYEGKNLPPDDDEAAKVLISEIGKENILFTFSTKLTPDQADNFYSDVKDRYSQIAIDSETTVWDTIYNFAQSGPLTFMLIYREEGDAVDWWRAKMGKTRPAEADPLSIRGKFAIQEKLPNNLTHGSDSKESVKKEIGVLRNIISNIDNQVSETSRQFPSSETLLSLGFIENGDYTVSIKRVFDSGMRSESWIYGYSINYIDKKGNIHTKFLKEKNIISMAGGLREKAERQAARIRQLELIDIKTPRLYGVREATIYQEFIPLDTTGDVFVGMQKTLSLDERTKNLLDQLIDIGYSLDRNGFNPLNFLNDLIFDNQIGQFLYMDTGSDLGDFTGIPTKSCLKTLTQKFPEHVAYINAAFQVRNIP